MKITLKDDSEIHIAPSSQGYVKVTVRNGEARVQVMVDARTEVGSLVQSLSDAAKESRG